MREPAKSSNFRFLVRTQRRGGYTCASPFRDAFGHTPLSLKENIPWRCKQLVVGTGAYGRLPILDEVKREADERGVN
jgi:hypothetical protein